MKKILNRNLFHYSIIFLGMTCLIFLRFYKWLPQGFWGDDLNSLQAFYHGNFSSSFSQALLSAYVGKYRPVYQLFNWVLFSIFGKNIDYYMCINFCIQILSGFIFYITVLKLSNRQFFLSNLLTLLFVSSKFALFQMTLVIGYVESIALVLFQLALLSLIKSFEKDNFIVCHLMALIFVGLSMFTHERYIVVALWFALTFAILPEKYISLKQRIAFIFGYSFLIGVNIIIKRYYLHLPFFVGTGGTNIAFDYASILEHTKDFYLSLLGFNHGPLYLFGVSILLPDTFLNFNQNLLYLILATIFFLTSTCFVFKNIVGSANPLKNAKILCMAFLLIVMLSVPPIMTIRVEGRWIYSAYLVLLYLIAWSASLSQINIQKHLLVACLFMTMFFSDSYVASSFGSIYLTGWTRIAGTIKNELLPIYQKTHKPNLILEIEDESLKDTLIANHFFEFYSGFNKNVFYVKNDDELAKLKKIYPSFFAFKYNNNFHFERV